jgi:hypothetical protein
MTSEPITEREFNRALKSLEDLIRDGQQANDAANKAILAQATKTNGRLARAEIAIAILQWGYGLGAAILAGWFFRVWP